MYAIIETGGKQYKVQEGDVVLLKSLRWMQVRKSLLTRYWRFQQKVR